jgi:hypothetical protein
MATALVEMLGRDSGETVMLILGAGHVRNIIGEYERVADKRFDVRQLNLRIRGVADSPDPIESHTQELAFNGTRFAPDHEYLGFSESAMRSGENPCEAFRRHMEKCKRNNAL